MAEELDPKILQNYMMKMFSIERQWDFRKSSLTGIRLEKVH